jgi:hypothetical protein
VQDATHNTVARLVSHTTTVVSDTTTEWPGEHPTPA